jgi:hypothetical protein
MDEQGSCKRCLGHQRLNSGDPKCGLSCYRKHMPSLKDVSMGTIPAIVKSEAREKSDSLPYQLTSPRQPDGPIGRRQFRLFSLFSRVFSFAFALLTVCCGMRRLLQCHPLDAPYVSCHVIYDVNTLCPLETLFAALGLMPKGDGVTRLRIGVYLSGWANCHTR